MAGKTVAGVLRFGHAGETIRSRFSEHGVFVILQHS